MNEYKINKLPKELRRELKKAGIDIVEQVFKRERSWLIYTVKNIEDIFDSYGVEYEKADVDSTGWETGWRNYLADGWLTNDVYYCFEDKSFDDGRTVLQINPALAFGTGGHGTTKGAARLSAPVAKDRTVLDVGTGSGILAILASLKGALNVYACDIDPVALPNAMENAALNGVNNIIFWAGGISELADGVKIDMVVANIITSVLTLIHPAVLRLAPEYIIYSGILQKEYAQFMEVIDTSGYEVDGREEIDEWCAVRFKRRAV